MPFTPERGKQSANGSFRMEVDMGWVNIWLSSYLHPRRAMDALAARTTPLDGAFYALLRGVMLSLLFYLPFYLLKFQPISPAALPIFDTPDYYLYAVLYWPVFGVLSWVYLGGLSYVVLRALGYQAQVDQVLNLGGLLNLTIGVVLLIFDWLLVALNYHTDPVLIGMAHIIISDPWSMALTAIFYRKYFNVPYQVSILLQILVRAAYMPLAIVFLRT